MFGKIARIVLGFVLACVAAGITQVLFVKTPADLASAASGTLGAQLLELVIWGLLVATHSAIFAAAFALIAIGVSEMLKVRAMLYHVLAGVGIAMLGFYTQLMTETLGQPTVQNLYALAAFATAGAVGGFVYWLIAGRWAAHSRAGASGASPTTARTRLVVEDATVDVSKAETPRRSLSSRIAEAEASHDAGETTSVRIERTGGRGASGKLRPAD